MSADTDRIPPTVGPPAAERGPVCAHSRTPDDPPCEQPATVHIVTDSPEYGRVLLASCVEHEAIARAAGSFVAAHPYLPGFCGHEDVGWDEATNQCAVNVEPQIRAAGWVRLDEVIEALREMDPVEAAPAGQHAWEDAARILAERFSDKEATA